MNTTPNILKEFKAFTLQTKIADVKLFFNETTFSHFPIIDNKHFVGLIAETDAQIIEENTKELSFYQNSFTVFYALEKNNLLEIFNVFAANETNILPVINDEKEYLGYFDLIDILHFYNNTPFLNNNGEVILVEKEIRDFSFSEVCQIIESNNGKVLGAFIADSDATTVKTLIKFNAPEVNEIFHALRRYKYELLTNHNQDSYLEELKDRSYYLQKFLNI